MSITTDKLDIIIQEKQNIKNAIKRKGATVTDSLASFAPAIDSIKSGGKIEDIKTINITENKNYKVNPTFGFNGIKNIIINTNIKAQPVLTSLDVKNNGVYEPESIYTGFNKVTVNTPFNQAYLNEFKKIGWDKVYGYAPLNPGESADQYFYRMKNDINKSVAKYNDWRIHYTNASGYLKDTSIVYAPLIDTSRVITAHMLFGGCNQLKIVPTYNFSSLKEAYGLFANLTTATEAPYFYLPTLKIMPGLFAMDDAAEGQPQKYSHISKVPLYDTQNVIDMSFMFNHNDSLKTVPRFNTTKVTLMRGMFADCIALTSVPELDTRNVTDMNVLFDNCIALNNIPLLDTRNVEAMVGMFRNCRMKTVPLFNTQKVNNMLGMFETCPNLVSCPHFNTQNVTDMSWMFNNCSSLASVPLFNTSKVTAMLGMFGSCSSLTSVPAFDTRNVNDMSQMFDYCYKLTSVPQFNTDKVTDMSWMFEECNALKKTPELNISKVTQMSGMFGNCKMLTEVRFKGGHKGIDCENMFQGVTTTGKAYFKNDGGDYSDIIAVLPASWTYERYN